MIIRDLNNVSWQRDADGHLVKPVWEGCHLLLAVCATDVELAHDNWMLVLRGQGHLKWSEALLPLSGGVLTWVDAHAPIQVTPAAGGELVLMLSEARAPARRRSAAPPGPATAPADPLAAATGEAALAPAVPEPPAARPAPLDVKPASAPVAVDGPAGLSAAPAAKPPARRPPPAPPAEGPLTWKLPPPKP